MHERPHRQSHIPSSSFCLWRGGKKSHFWIHWIIYYFCRFVCSSWTKSSWKLFVSLMQFNGLPNDTQRKEKTMMATIKLRERDRNTCRSFMKCLRLNWNISNISLVSCAIRAATVAHWKYDVAFLFSSLLPISGFQCNLFSHFFFSFFGVFRLSFLVSKSREKTEGDLNKHSRTLIILFSTNDAMEWKTVTTKRRCWLFMDDSVLIYKYYASLKRFTCAPFKSFKYSPSFSLCKHISAVTFFHSILSFATIAKCQRVSRANGEFIFHNIPFRRQFYKL